MLYAVEGLGSVGEEEETWVLLRVAVVHQVLYVSGVWKARFTFLACNLSGIDKEGEGGLESICEAASKDLIDDRANGDGPVVTKEVTRTGLVQEGGDGSVQVSGEGPV